MFQRILVPLDGSTRAEQALAVAARLARASEGSLVLLQVVTSPIDSWAYQSEVSLLHEQIVETSIAGAETYLALLARSEDLAGIKIKTEVMYGTAAQSILHVTHARRADLIVMCSHGRTGISRWALGSVAHQIAHHSPVPVLVLREGQAASLLTQPHAARPLCALVPLDGSPLAETALVPAANLVAALATPAEGTLHLTQVVKLFPTSADEGFVRELNSEALERAKTYLASMQARLPEMVKGLTRSATWSVALDNDVADALIGTAENGEEAVEAGGFGGSDLIAMSTHSRGGLERWVMGSVTERVLSAAQLPLLIVRPQKVKQTEPV
jgi:nucleotide-binding universal stress UspA family protein